MKRMKFWKSAILCSVILLPITLFAQTKKQKKAIKDWREQFYTGTIQQASFKQTIHFHDLSGEILITVQINGKSYNMVFDSGAPTVISDELVKELKLEKTKSFQISDGTGEEKSINGYTLKELKIGEVTFNNTGCLANSLDNINQIACAKIDGIIGVNLMHECYWKINFQDSTLTFSNELPPISNTTAAMDFEEDFTGSPYFQLQYGGNTFPVELDLGSNGPLTIIDTSKENREKQSRTFTAGYGISAFTIYHGVPGRQYIGIVDSIKFNASIFKNVLVFLSKEGRTCNIGTSFIRNYETIFDWKSHKIYMNQLNNDIDTNLSKSFGLKFALDSNKLRVLYLWEGSKAEREGIKIGDIITAVDDLNTTVATKDQYCELLQKMKHTTALKLTLVDAANNSRNIILYKYALVKK